MARPSKHRRICRIPRIDRFIPENEIDTSVIESVSMTLDEYETIRLLDDKGLTQEQCARQMDVARTTVTAIYDSARKKLADVLVNGKRLILEGGHYRCCNGRSQYCKEECPANRVFPQESIAAKERKNMKIAVTYQPTGEIFQHFGHTEWFKLYEAEEGKIIKSEVISTNGSGHGALAALLGEQNVDALICGGIGGGAQMALAEAGIALYGGVTGNADAAAEALAKGELQYDPDVQCSHHDHSHGECGSHEGHACGGHCQG